MILDKPTKVCLDKQEILFSEFDFANKKNVNTRVPFSQVEDLAFISDKSSVSKGALKRLQGKSVSFISKGEPTALVFWLNEHNKFFHYSKKMSELPKSKKRKLAFVFCKGVCNGRIKEIRCLNKKRQDAFLAERLKAMKELNAQLKRVYRNDAELKAIEGNIAKHFFACIRHLLPKNVGFEERNRFGKDLYNALLNASHGLLRQKIARHLLAIGLNPVFGFLHFQNSKSKPFLVWDFAEFWVAYLDKLCFYAVNKGIFSEADLVNAKSGNGKWLNKQGWQKLYKLMIRVDENKIGTKAVEFCDYLDGKKARFGWA